MLIDTMHTIASMLQSPVIALLIALVAIAVIIVGMLVAEFFTEHRYFKLSLPALIDELDGPGDPAGVIERSGLLGRQKKALAELLAHPHATPLERESLAVSLVAAEQRIFDNRVKVTDLIAKVAPMLGLMGTLIPLGPGIMAIGEGQTELLAESLLVAFDTTVLGLIAAVVAVCVSTLRKSWYAKYMAAFEAAAECVLEKANARGTGDDKAAANARGAGDGVTGNDEATATARAATGTTASPDAREASR